MLIQTVILVTIVRHRYLGDEHGQLAGTSPTRWQGHLW